jgi:selenide,water dikinase
VQLLYDPQTSGGLLAAIAPEMAEEALARLGDANVAAQAVGVVESPSAVALRLRRMV